MSEMLDPQVTSVDPERKSALSRQEIRDLLDGKVDDSSIRQEFEQATTPPAESEPERQEASAPVPAAPKTPSEPAPVAESVSAEPTKDGAEAIDDDPLKLIERELQLRDLKMQRLENENQKWQTLAQQRQGKLDYLEKNDGTAPKPAGWGQTRRSTESTGNPETDRLAALEQEAVERARQNAVVAFTQQYPDLIQDQEFHAMLKERAQEYAEDLQSGNTKRVTRATNLLLQDARLELTIQREEAAIAEARQRQASAAETIRQRKLDSGATTSDAAESSSTPPKTYGSYKEQLMDMDTDQLAALWNKVRSRR